jgi:multidrug efflux pump subunit AcrA (membrane-fusion protein)
MLKIDKSTKDQLIDLLNSRGLAIEGNILKVIDAEDDTEFAKYLQDAIEKDREARRRRLDITKQVQSQNQELTQWKRENERIQTELRSSLDETQRSKEEAESAKAEALQLKDEADAARLEAERMREAAEQAKSAAENDLEIVQRRSQFEMMGTIVRTALIVICSVGIVVTAMYVMSMIMNKDTQVIGSTWSNIIGILLTNAFSIVGTIMGVKYASEKSE